MAYTYTWTDAEQTSLRREDADGNVAFVPTDPGNRDYAEYLRSGITADAYVAPAPAAPLTPAEKLANAGLIADELKTLLGI